MTSEAMRLHIAIVDMAGRYGAAERDYAYAVADASPTGRAHRACLRRLAALARLVGALAELASGAR